MNLMFSDEIRIQNIEFGFQEMWKYNNTRKSF